MTAVAYRHVSAAEVNQRIREFRAVYAIVFAEPPYNEGPEMADKFVGWVRDESAEPGFAFVEAVAGAGVVGFAYGHTRAAGQWWRGADRPQPTESTAGPTFAVMEWAVLLEHRGRGTGQRLMGELLAGRPEAFATLMVNPAAAARGMYERAGWAHVGSTRPGKMPGMDVMLLQLAQPGAAAPAAGS